MRSPSILAALLIITLFGAGAAHAFNACSVGSAHVGHCGHPHARPACCQNGETAPLVSRLERAGGRAQIPFAVTSPPIGRAEIVTATARSQACHPAPFDRFSSLRLHLVLATLMI
jgi:hypothetical protein